MKTRLFHLLTLLVLLVGLVPATAAFADGDDDGNYEFLGTIDSLPTSGLYGTWVVSGRDVYVTAGRTRIEQEHGPITMNACVEVKGWLQGNGAVDALKVETKEPWKCGSGGGGGGGGSSYEFHGTIVSFPAGWIGDWVVNDGFTNRAVHVDAFTRIEQEHGAMTVNACVEVKGWLQGDRSVNATKIETKEPWKCGGSGGGGGGGGSRYEFYGTIDSLPATGRIGEWVVSGRTVYVTISTRIEEEHGRVAVGAYVEVKGSQRADGSVDATKIEVKIGSGGGGGGGGGGGSYYKFYGTIQALPGTIGWIGNWTVNNRTVYVDSSTRIEQEHGAVAVGAYVEVKGWSQTNGTVNATKIEVKSSPGGGGGGGGGGGYVKFYGTVDSLPDTIGWIGNWTVNNRTVYVDATTRIEQEHGTPAVGAYVEVKGWLAGGSSTTVNATKIEIKDSPGGGGAGGFTKFYGTVEQLPSTGGYVGIWIVGARTVEVSANTWIDQRHGRAAVGAYVEVEGYVQSVGSVNATKIEVKRSSSGGGGSIGYVKFYGVVEDLPATTGWIGDWMVSDRLVSVTRTTRIEQEHGVVRLGAFVEVKGIQQNGSVTATKIEVKR